MNEQTKNMAEGETYLECERSRTFALLMMAAGMFGAFTYTIRGGIFCNAQTGNCVLLAIAIARGAWANALYYLIPISAYFMGAVISEILPSKVKRLGLLRWDTLFVGFEIFVVIGLGLLPEAAPVQITQIIINFIASMQYNTFRQAEHIPMATTFCTNHIRQLGIWTVKAVKHNFSENERARCRVHILMLTMFVLGGIISAFFCYRIAGKAIWISILPLGFVFADLVYADLTKERGLLSVKPSGH